jgi:hypothetical protein
MPANEPDRVLSLLGARPDRVVTLADVPGGNANWLVETVGGGHRRIRPGHDRTAAIANGDGGATVRFC